MDDCLVFDGECRCNGMRPTLFPTPQLPASFARVDHCLLEILPFVGCYDTARVWILFCFRGCPFSTSLRSLNVWISLGSRSLSSFLSYTLQVISDLTYSYNWLKSMIFCLPFLMNSRLLHPTVFSLFPFGWMLKDTSNWILPKPNCGSPAPNPFPQLPLATGLGHLRVFPYSQTPFLHRKLLVDATFKT